MVPPRSGRDELTPSPNRTALGAQKVTPPPCDADVIAGVPGAWRTPFPFRARTRALPRTPVFATDRARGGTAHGRDSLSWPRPDGPKWPHLNGVAFSL